MPGAVDSREKGGRLYAADTRGKGQLRPGPAARLPTLKASTGRAGELEALVAGIHAYAAVNARDARHAAIGGSAASA
jgi:hypothetical protein